MRSVTLLAAALWIGGLSACVEPTAEREAGAEIQALRRLEAGLSIQLNGGAIRSVSRASEDAPYVVEVRATDFEVEAVVFNETCEPKAITFEIKYLGCPGEVALSRRAFLETDTFLAQLPGRQVGFEADPDAPDWTPLEGEKIFGEVAQACDEESIETLIWTTTLSRASLQIDTELGALEAVPSAGPGACVGPFTEDDSIGSARLAVRHRARRMGKEEGPIRFALWANDRGDEALRARFIGALAEADPAPDFIIVNGDFTPAGEVSEIEAIAAFDATGLPWYATVGDRDVNAGQTDALLQALGALTFRVDVGPLEVIVLDSADATLGSGAYALLDDWNEEATTRAARVAVTHYPPLDPAGLRGYGFKQRLEGVRLISMLGRHNTQALIVSQLGGYQERRFGDLPVHFAGSAGSATGGPDGAPEWLMITAGCVASGEASPGPCAEGSLPGPEQTGVVLIERRPLP